MHYFVSMTSFYCCMEFPFFLLSYNPPCNFYFIEDYLDPVPCRSQEITEKQQDSSGLWRIRNMEGNKCIIIIIIIIIIHDYTSILQVLQCQVEYVIGKVASIIYIILKLITLNIKLE